MDDHTPDQPASKKPRKPRLNAQKPTPAQRSRARPLENIPLGIAALYLLDIFGCLTAAQLARLEPLKELGLVQVVGYRKYHFNATIDEHPFGYHELNLLTALGARRLEQHFAASGERYTRRYYTKLRHDLLRATPHDLEIVNAGALLIGHAGIEGWELERWQVDTALKAARVRQETLLGNVEPDACFVLRKENVGVPFFLEIDRETEPADGDAPNSWETKIRKYGAYLERRYPDDPYFPYMPLRPRVLVVTTNEERLQRLLNATVRAGGKNAYYFTLREYLDPVQEYKAMKNGGERPVPVALDLLGAMWLTPTGTAPRALRDDLARAFSYAPHP